MKLLILTLLIALNTILFSQVAVSTGSYFQDFGTTDIMSWTNNVTCPGWYETGTFQAHLNITAASPSNTGGFYTYECNANNDQKIGTRASGGTGTMKYGVVLQNTTGSTISNIMVSYKGYQLSLAQNGNTNVITFDYIVGATPPSISAAGGTGVAALNFTQLQSNAASGSAQVMGYPCTQVANITGCITVTIPNNSYILLRWTDVDDSGNDHHMAIDDIDVQFIATTLTVNSPVMCASQPATLTVTGAANYIWAPPATLSSSTGSAVVANPAGTTVYTISATVGSCPTKTITSTVTVNPNPVVTVNSETVCASGSATLTATGAASYTWSPGTGLSSTTGSLVSANPGSTTVYTVTGNSGACSVTPGTATVTILSSPILAAIGSQTICSGSSTTLTASGATNYTWSPGTGLSSTTGSTVLANPATTNVYTISGDNGTCTALPVTFTVTVITTPTLSVNSATVCSGGSVTLTATGATGYTWVNVSTLSSGTGNTVIANPLSTTVYTLSGSIASCSATPVPATVTVLPNPSITINSASICTSGFATLIAAGAANYTWSPSATLSSSTGNSVTANPLTTTVYTVTGSLGVCPVTAGTATVTVFLNSVIAVNSQTICSGSSATLTASGTTNYTWSPGTGLSSTTGSTVLANPATTTVYTISGDNGTCTALPVTFTVTVITTPTLSVNSATVCAGRVVVLTANGAASYSWNPATNLNISSGNIVTATPAGTTVYTVTGTVNTCSAIAESTVTVIPFQSAAFTYTSSKYCQAAGNTLPVITGVAGGVFTGLPAGLSLNPITGLITLSTSTQNSYTVSYSTTGNCTDTQFFTLNINPTPSLIVNSRSICAGETTTLTATATIPGGNYHWMPGNTNGTGLIVSPLANIIYTVTYILNGCTVGETLPVTVNSLPDASVVSSSGLGTTTEGEDIVLTASGMGTYAWNTGSTGNTLKVQPTENSNYCVTVTNSFGCKNSACITIHIDKESTLYVPNVFTPNGDGLNDVFNIPYSNITEFNIKLFNRWGEQLFQSGDIEKSWDGTFGGKEVSDGVYVYVITAKGTDKIEYNKRGHVTVLH